MEAKANEYFKDENTPKTKMGLAMFLGFAYKKSLSDYEAKSEYSPFIKRAIRHLHRSLTV